MRKLILLTLLALGASAARAENGDFYLGAGVVRGERPSRVRQRAG